MNNFFEFTEEEVWAIYKRFERYNKGCPKEKYIKRACQKLRVTEGRYRKLFSQYYDSYMEAKEND